MRSFVIDGRIRAIALLVVTLIGADLYAQGRPWQNTIGGPGQPRLGTYLGTIPKQDMNASETAGLVYMREEEKLARDVYNALYQTWGLRVFANIAISEQRHMDALEALLDRYSIADPAANAAPGIFTNAALKGLYGDLVSQGNASATAALRVGATIEDLDIHDLDKAIAGTDNQDLAFVYGNLRNASGNHLRAFLWQLESLGENYFPQYITAAEMNEMLAVAGGRGMGFRENGGPGRRSLRQPGSNPNCPYVR
jgi:hypothetical protein